MWRASPSTMGTDSWRWNCERKWLRKRWLRRMTQILKVLSRYPCFWLIGIVTTVKISDLLPSHWDIETLLLYMYHLQSPQYALILITILVTWIAITFFSVFDCLFIFTDFFSHAIVLFLDEIKFRFYASLIWMIYPVMVLILSYYSVISFSTLILGRKKST